MSDDENDVPSKSDAPVKRFHLFELMCSKCNYGTDKKYAHNMYRHLRVLHCFTEEEVGAFKQAHIVRSARAIKQKERENQMEVDFTSWNEFQTWFDNKKLETCSSFFVRWKKKLQTKELNFLKCHREKFARKVVRKKSRMGKRCSSFKQKKIDHECTSFARIEKYYDGRVHVAVSFQHNHELDPSIARLTATEKTMLKELMTDEILTNSQVIEKLNVMEKAPFSRLNYLQPSHISGFRRDWNMDSSKMAKQDLLSIRKRVALSGEGNGVLHFNSMVEGHGNDFQMGIIHLKSEEILNNERVKIDEGDSFFTVHIAGKADVQVHLWKDCTCDKTHNNHCPECDCCSHRLLCTCHTQLAGVTCVHMHMVSTFFELNIPSEKNEEKKKVARNPVADQQEPETSDHEEERNPPSTQGDEEQQQQKTYTRYTNVSTLSKFEEKIVMNLNELFLNSDPSSQNALQEICEGICDLFDQKMPSFITDKRVREERVGVTNKVHAPIRSIDRMFGQTRKRPKIDDDDDDDAEHRMNQSDNGQSLQ